MRALRHIRILTTAGRGTTVTVYFPAATSRRPGPHPPQPRHPPRGGLGHRVVIDDEDVVRDVACRIFAPTGSGSMPSRAGWHRGHARFRERSQDIRRPAGPTWPRMDGAATLVEIRSIRPSSDLLASGYTSTTSPLRARGSRSSPAEPFRSPAGGTYPARHRSRDATPAG
jgi:hypothetical protein